MVKQDFFDRANENPITGDWGTVAGFIENIRLFNNGLIGSIGDRNAMAMWTKDTFGSNQYSQIVFSTLSTPDAGPACRLDQIATTGYFVTYWNNPFCELYKIDSATHLRVGNFNSPTSTLARWDTVKLTCVDVSSIGTISVFKNDILVGSYIDSSPATLYGAGVFIFDAAVALDNWRGGDAPVHGRRVTVSHPGNKAAIGSISSLHIGPVEGNVNTANTGTYVTSAFTPSANETIIAFISNSKASAPDTPTMAGCNFGSWVGVTSLNAGSVHRISVFRTRGTAPVSGAATIFFPAAQTGCNWAIHQVSNSWFIQDDYGSSSIVQFASTLGTNVSSATVSLSSFGAAASRNAVMAGFVTARSTGLVAESPYVTLFTTGNSLPVTQLYTMWKTGGDDLTPSFGWTSGSPVRGIALEIKSKYQFLSRTISFGKSILTSVIRAIIGSGGTIYTRTMSTIKATSISLSRLRRLLRNVTAIKATSISLSRLRRLVRAVPLGKQTNFIVSRLRRLTRTIGESIAPIFSLSRLRRLVRTISGTISVSARVQRAASYVRTLRISVQARVSVSRLMRLIRSIGFAIPRSHIASRLKTFARTVSAVISKSYSVSRMGRYVRFVSESARPALSLSRLRRLLRNISTSVPTSMVLSRARRLIRAISSSISPSLSVSRLRRLIRSVSVKIQTTETVSRIGRYVRTISSKIGTFGIVSGVRVGAGIIYRNVVDAINTSLRVSRVGRYIRKINEIISFSSTVGRLSRFLRNSYSRIVVMSRASRFKGYVRTVYVLISGGSSVSRVAQYSRNVLALIENRPIVSRVVNYIRSIYSFVANRAIVGWANPVGEAVILLLSTSNKLLYDFTTFAMSKLKSDTGSGRVDIFDGKAQDKSQFDSKSKSKDNFG